MAPKRKSGARKAAAAVDKLPTEDVQKQEAEASASASAEDTIAAPAGDEGKAEGEPSPKKTKVEEKKKRGRKPKAASKKAVGLTKKSADDDDKEDEDGTAEDEVLGSDGAGKVIVIEASKECNCFKIRAAKVQTGLTTAIPGIEVLINPDKPRKGCFEVRGKEGNIYLSLLGLPRPFTKLKNMDMDKAIEDIVAKVK